MTSAQEQDAMAFLAQGASVKEAAAWVGVSEWEIAALFRACVRRPRKRA